MRLARVWSSQSWWSMEKPSSTTCRTVVELLAVVSCTARGMSCQHSAPGLFQYSAVTRVFWVPCPSCSMGPYPGWSCGFMIMMKKRAKLHAWRDMLQSLSDSVKRLLRRGCCSPGGRCGSPAPERGAAHFSLSCLEAGPALWGAQPFVPGAARRRAFECHSVHRFHKN